MHTPRRRKNNLWHALAGDSGLTSIQWVGRSAVALVTIAVIVGVFAAGGSQEIQQAASTGTDRRIDCLYNNCQPWENDSSGPKAGAAAQASGGASLQTAGAITAEAASDGASLRSDAASRWDQFWSGAGDFFDQTVQFGKDLAGKLGDLAGNIWDGLPGWIKGARIGFGIVTIIGLI